MNKKGFAAGPGAQGRMGFGVSAGWRGNRSEEEKARGGSGDSEETLSRDCGMCVVPGTKLRLGRPGERLRESVLLVQGLRVPDRKTLLPVGTNGEKRFGSAGQPQTPSRVSISIQGVTECGKNEQV